MKGKLGYSTAIIYIYFCGAESILVSLFASIHVNLYIIVLNLPFSPQPSRKNGNRENNLDK